MKGRFGIFSVGIVALLVVAVLVGAGLYGGATAQEGARTNADAPEQVVADFYDWYLGYIGKGETMRNPLVDGVYRECGYLTDDFVTEIDETLASFDQGAFDPILMAQDVPERIDVGASDVAGDKATVTVEMYWGGNPTPTERTVTLFKIDGAWKIAGVRS